MYVGTLLDALTGHFRGNRQESKERDVGGLLANQFCKTLTLPVLLYGAEAWTLLSTDAAEKFYVRPSVQYELLMIFASDPTMSCMSSSNI